MLLVGFCIKKIKSEHNSSRNEFNFNVSHLYVHKFYQSF